MSPIDSTFTAFVLIRENMLPPNGDGTGSVTVSHTRAGWLRSEDAGLDGGFEIAATDTDEDLRALADHAARFTFGDERATAGGAA
jgi:hypothetical protein